MSGDAASAGIIEARPCATGRETPRIWPALILIGAALLVLVAAMGRTHVLLARMNEFTAQRGVARDGRLLAEQTLSVLKDLETGSRGFALTGEDAFLAPYEQARAALPRLCAQLAPGLALEEHETQDRAAFEGLVQQRTALASRVVERRREEGAAILEERPLLDEGKLVMDQLRLLVHRIDQRLSGRIDHMNIAVSLLRREADAWSSLSSGVAFVLVSVGFVLIARESLLRHALESRLRRSNAELEDKIALRTAALAASRDRITAFASEENRAVEAERRRLSREVHDQIGQVFTAIRLIAASVPREAFPDGQAEALHQALDLGLASARRITAELRPPLLDDLGLAAAVNHYVRPIAAREKLACEVAIRDHEIPDAAQAVTLFRIIQEAVTNVLRHAHAHSIVISGGVAGSAYVLQIADDGAGIAATPRRPEALGITGMRERAVLLGGECTVAARPGGGTLVDIRLPLTGPRP